MVSDTSATPSRGPLAVPVAFFVCNRVEHTMRVLGKIRQVRPLHLLLVADGPKPDDPADFEACKAVRHLLQEMIDWPCEVQIDFAEASLGKARRMASGLNWVFTQVTSAIILEDDALPSESFFFFCEEMLERYRDQEQVLAVGGSHRRHSMPSGDASYFFSHSIPATGWATWRRAWKHYDFSLAAWPQLRAEGLLTRVFPDAAVRVFWEEQIDQVFRGESERWDCQWCVACWNLSGLSILPARNLVGTLLGHENSEPSFTELVLPGLPAEELAFPLVHPKTITRDDAGDAELEQALLSVEPPPGPLERLLERLSEWRKAPPDSRRFRLGLNLRLFTIGAEWRDKVWLLKPSIRYHLAKIGFDLPWTAQARAVELDLEGGGVRIQCRDELCDSLTLAEVFGEDQYAWTAAMGPLDHVLDLGAGIGAFTLYIHHLHPAAACTCIEPDPRNLELLRLNLEPHPADTVVPAAVTGDGNSPMVSLYISPSRSSHSIVPQSHETRQVPVAARSLSSVLSAFTDHAVDLVKIDIEGAEAVVLAGTQPHLLCKVRNFLIAYRSPEVRAELRRIFRWDFEVQMERTLPGRGGLVHFRRSKRSEPA